MAFHALVFVLIALPGLSTIALESNLTMAAAKKYRLGNHFVQLQEFEVGGWSGSGRRSSWQTSVITPDGREEIVGRFDTERLALKAGEKKIREL